MDQNYSFLILLLQKVFSLKFIYSMEATTIWKDLSILFEVMYSKFKSSKKFAAFSECINFIFQSIRNVNKNRRGRRIFVRFYKGFKHIASQTYIRQLPLKFLILIQESSWKWHFALKLRHQNFLVHGNSLVSKERSTLYLLNDLERRWQKMCENSSCKLYSAIISTFF